MSQLLEAEVKIPLYCLHLLQQVGLQECFPLLYIGEQQLWNPHPWHVCNQYGTYIYNTHTYPCCLNVHACTNTLIIHTLWCTHCCSFTLTAHTLNTSLILAQIHKSAYHTDTKKYMPHNAHKLPLSCKHVLLSYSAVATRTPYFSLFLPRWPNIHQLYLHLNPSTAPFYIREDQPREVSTLTDSGCHISISHLNPPTQRCPYIHSTKF